MLCSTGRANPKERSGHKRIFLKKIFIINTFPKIAALIRLTMDAKGFKLGNRVSVPRGRFMNAAEPRVLQLAYLRELRSRYDPAQLISF
jgi:hypothetical protein